VYAEIVYDSAFYFDNKCNYPEATVFIMSGRNLRYLIALLNSKFITYCFKTFYAGGDLRGNTFRYKKSFLINLPLPKISTSQQKPFEELVNKIIVKKEKGEDTTDLEREIDLMVYKLYDLTFDEVKIVEPDFPLTEEEYENYE